MKNDLNSIQKFIESAFLVLLLLGLFVGKGSAAPTSPPLPTSYWGNSRIGNHDSAYCGCDLLLSAAEKGGKINE